MVISLKDARFGNLNKSVNAVDRHRIANLIGDPNANRKQTELKTARVN
jgi:hypothetical protein